MIQRNLISQLKNKWPVIFVLAFGLLVRFYPFLLGKTLFFGDNYSLMVPGKLFTATWLRQGVLPLWNPNIFGGVPWIGNINESIFYPTTLLFALFNPTLALNLTVLLHLALTFVGMYCLAKFWTKNTWGSLVAAVIWTFSTQVTGALNNLTTLQSITWVPWVIYAGLKLGDDLRSKIWLALAILLQMLGGYPQFIFYTVILTVVMSFWKSAPSLRTGNHKLQWLGRWIMAGALSIGFTAFIWMPFVEYLLQSTRTVQSQAQSLAGSLHLAELIKLLLPYFFDNPAAGLKWGPNWNGMPNLVMYVTWLGLLLIGLVLLSKRRKRTDVFVAAILVFSLLFALGDKLPGFALFQVLLPLFKASRGPSLILAVTNALAALWVGDLLVRLELKPKAYRWLLVLFGLGFLLTLVASIILSSQFNQVWVVLDTLLKHKLSLGGFHTVAKDQLIFTSIITNILVNCAGLVAALFVWQRRRWLVLLLILTLDMQWNTAGMLFFGPANLYPTWSQIQAEQRDQLHQIVGHERVLTSDFNTPYTDFGAYWEALTVRRPFSDSYIGVQELTSYDLLHQMRIGLAPDWNMVASLPVLNGYVSLLPQDFNNVWNDPQADPGINRVSEIKLNDPRLATWGVKYYWLDTWYPNASQQLPYPKMLDAGRWQLYELPTASRFSPDGGQIYNFIVSENPNHLAISLINADAKSLTIADRYDPNWRAVVNGKQVTISDVSGLRRVPLVAGSNVIELNYRPRFFGWGLALSGVTGLGLAALWIIKKLLRPSSK